MCVGPIVLFKLKPPSLKGWVITCVLNRVTRIVILFFITCPFNFTFNLISVFGIHARVSVLIL